MSHTLSQDAITFLPAFCLFHPPELTQFCFITLLQNKVEWNHPSSADIKYPESSSLFSYTFLYQLTQNNSTVPKGLGKNHKIVA
jgi:hypothetical protein